MGRVAFAVASGSGAGSARRRALFMPLNPVECVADVRPGRELLTLREPRALHPLHGIMTSPVRSAVVMFIAELLERLLRQSESDPALFDFIRASVELLNEPATSPANFHLYFMVRLAERLGILPDLDGYRPGMLLDLREGLFRSSMPLHGHALSAADSATAARLLRISAQNQHLYRFNRLQRGEIVDVMLDFFSLHIADLSGMNSPAILKEIASR